MKAEADWRDEVGVYFIFDGRDCIKIGWGQPRERLKKFRTGSAGRVALLAVAVGEPRTTELEYHHRFELYRVDREWFSLNPELKAEIERVQRVYRNHGAPSAPSRAHSGRNKSHVEQPHRHRH
jgi:Meiotically Up-regulated Gene 113 (MUG113) protein